MTLAIHILLVLSVLGVGFCLFITVLTIRELDNIIIRLCNKVDELDKKQNDANAIREGIREAILADFRKRYHPQIRVTDDNPLDFPNDRKE